MRKDALRRLSSGDQNGCICNSYFTTTPCTTASGRYRYQATRCGTATTAATNTLSIDSIRIRTKRKNITVIDNIDKITVGCPAAFATQCDKTAAAATRAATTTNALSKNAERIFEVGSQNSRVGHSDLPAFTIATTAIAGNGNQSACGCASTTTAADALCINRRRTCPCYALKAGENLPCIGHCHVAAESGSTAITANGN